MKKNPREPGQSGHARLGDAVKDNNTVAISSRTAPLPQVLPAGSNNLAARRAAEAARNQRLRQAAKIHALGERATVEFAEAARQQARDCGKFDRLLARFSTIDADLLRALGADRLPPPPLRLIERP